MAGQRERELRLSTAGRQASTRQAKDKAHSVAQRHHQTKSNTNLVTFLSIRKNTIVYTDRSRYDGYAETSTVAKFLHSQVAARTVLLYSDCSCTTSVPALPASSLSRSAPVPRVRLLKFLHSQPHLYLDLHRCHGYDS